MSSIIKKRMPFEPSSFFVPETGFEPARLAAPPPQGGASTNFATRALAANIIAYS